MPVMRGEHEAALSAIVGNLCLLQDGTWSSDARRPISYADEHHGVCRDIDADSFWFTHRNRCILACVQKYSPGGFILDVGGGNGVVTSMLQSSGIECALLEPSHVAVQHARERGVRHRILSSLEDARIVDGSVPAVGMFDVLEHIEDDAAALHQVRSILRPDGTLYLTVPAHQALWSKVDDNAGHFRRYSRRSLVHVLSRHGFAPVYAGYIFSLLLIPQAAVMLKRDRDSHMVSRKAAYLRLPAGLARLFHPELPMIRMGIPIPFGSSVICVARRS